MIFLTRQQRVALKRVYDRDHENRRQYAGNKRQSYRQFRSTVQPEFGGAAIMVHWCGMWLGIEPDGHTHS